MKPLTIGGPLLAALCLVLPAPASAAAPRALAPRAPVASLTARAVLPAPVAAFEADGQSGARRRPPSSGGSRGSSGGSQGGAVRRPSGSSGGSSGGSSSGQGATTSSRRRDGGRDSNIVVDRAVPRSQAPRPPRNGHWYRPDPRYYDPWGYGAFGLGYFYYSPWSWAPYYGGAYGGPYYSGRQYYYGPYGYDIGSVRLKVKPEDAEVYVDGYYAGVVDDFDGIFQSLKLDSGAYRIEIRKEGYEPLTFDVRVQVDRKITFHGDMKPIP
ncbi:MAG: PEGA domain-containing protein [Vicinamibacterales bacterium]